MLGYDTHGSGTLPVIVLHDWLCDTSTWDGARAFLDEERFTWAFVDLRGYGRSRDLRGAFTLEEAAADVLEVADALGWQRFAIVGHSMSSLVVLHLAQRLPERIDRAVVLTPPPPRGFGADEETLEALRAMGRGDDARRLGALRHMWGTRLSERWTRHKLDRWRAVCAPEAVEGYVPMFARDGLPDPARRIAIPLFAITGEHDGEPMRAVAVSESLGALSERLCVTALADCGHYPMQEAPPLLVALVERFLAGEVEAEEP